VSAIDEKALQAVLAIIEATRLRIMFLIGQQGGVCVNDIAGRFKISRPAISHHLSVLKSYGLMETQREGREIYYSIARSRVVETLRTLADALEACSRHGKAN
jgi:ArsR family transcriptional regulator